MKTIKFLALTVLMLTACKPSAAGLPDTLLVDGQPVDPLCFYLMGGAPINGGPVESIPVKNCGEGLIAKKRETKNGVTFSVYYEYEEDGYVDVGYPFLSYTYVGQSGEDSVAIVSWNGGGTGMFTSIELLEREGDTLKIKSTIAGGDRCNGGILEASVNDQGVVGYTQNITPYDMLVLGGNPERPFLKTVEPYQDLVACAACCYGVAKFSGDQLTGITLNPDLKDSFQTSPGDEIRPDQEKQVCFDNIMKLQLDAGQSEFTLDEWDTVMGEVEHVCLGRVEGE